MAHIVFCNTHLPYQHDPNSCQLHEVTTITCAADKLLVTIEPGSVDPGNKCRGNFQILFWMIFLMKIVFETKKIWLIMLSRLNIKFFLLHLQARRTVQQLAVTFFPPILVLVQPVVRLQWWIELCYTVKIVAGVQHTEARDIMNFRSSIYFGPDDAKIYPLKLHRNYQILS